MSPSSSVRHNNGFDVLRLFAAWLVLFSHCYPLRGIAEQEPLANVTEGLSFASLFAVYIFFAMSGYLVTRSWQRDPHPGRFIIRRALRILPALSVVVVITMVVVGPWMGVLPAAEYFRDGESWWYLLNILMYPIQHTLPGVFLDNPFPQAVNGSLWTLRLEFSFYIVIVIIGLTLRRWRYVTTAGAVICLLAFIGLDQAKTVISLPGHRQLILIVSNGIPFLVGAAIARDEWRCKIKGWHVVIVLLLMFLSHGTPAFKYVVPVVAAIGALFFAFHLKFDLSQWGDFSYGFYLWAFVVQQSIMHLFPQLSFVQFLLSCTVVTLLLAAVSWHLVEKRALGWKPR